MKRWNVFLLSVTAAALFMASIPAPTSAAAAAANSKQQGEPGFTQTVKDLDKELVEKAKEALKPFVNGEIDFEGVRYSYKIDGKKEPTLYSKAYRTVTHPVKGEEKIFAAEVTIKAQTGEIYQIRLDPQLSSLDEGIRTKIKAAITETEKSLSYDDITKLNIDGASGEISTLGSYHLVIDAKSGKVQMAIYYVPKSKVDQKVVQTAQQAAGALTGGKKTTFDSVQRFVGEGGDRYLFTQREQSINVSVEATNKVQNVSWEAERTVYRSIEELNKKFAKPKYTAAEAIKTMNPIIKKIFGIDVTGYKVTVKANEYTFSKEGSPGMIALINEKGKIYTLSRLRAK
ncbi:hypothetical protein [Paenibacillus alvei]|uniref:hypothetical protein n=1 Tax=Paenibacillus alvei TaxID=44250 RepID=UPI0018CEC95A|nr:hypothetical protein [Paenibacillus alvei]MBG9734869.1 hypothetical protein [Paenibacillus alvei]MBG9744744.1 hypothetical protein [Paenibacillus alvei]MCY9578832.1 hypothetical protein [Paenibacillus alvei]MCY9583888.1 hypothetical protein [Paenibacillus alvei]